MTKLAAATRNRNNAEMSVPTVPPITLSISKRFCSAPVANAMATDASTTTLEWPSEKNRPSPMGCLPSCISLRHVVDRRDVVSIDRVTKHKRVGEQRGADQNRIIVNRDQRRSPGQEIGGNQHGV